MGSTAAQLRIKARKLKHAGATQGKARLKDATQVVSGPCKQHVGPWQAQLDELSAAQKLQERLDAAERTNKQLAASIRRLQQETEGEKGELEQELSRLRRKYKKMRTDKLAVNERCEQLLYDNDALKLRVNTLEDENEELADAHENLQEELLVQREKEQELYQEQERVQSAKSKWVGIARQLELDLSNIRGLMEDYDEVYSKKVKEVERLAKEGRGMQQQQRTFAERYVAWRAKWSAQAEELEALRAFKQRAEGAFLCKICCDDLGTQPLACCSQAVCPACRAKCTACPFCRAAAIAPESLPALP